METWFQPWELPHYLTVGIMLPLFLWMAFGPPAGRAKDEKKGRAVWAKRAGFEIHPRRGTYRSDTMTGTLSGYRTKVELVPAVGFQKESLDTQFSIFLEPLLSTEVFVSAEGQPLGIVNRLSRPRVKLGDVKFDVKVHLRGPTRHDLTMLAAPALQWRLMQLLEDYPGSQIDDGTLSIRTLGYQDTEEILPRLELVATSLILELENVRNGLPEQAVAER